MHPVLDIVPGNARSPRIIRAAPRHIEMLGQRILGQGIHRGSRRDRVDPGLSLCRTPGLYIAHMIDRARPELVDGAVLPTHKGGFGSRLVLLPVHPRTIVDIILDIIVGDTAAARIVAFPTHRKRRRRPGGQRLHRGHRRLPVDKERIFDNQPRVETVVGVERMEVALSLLHILVADDNDAVVIVGVVLPLLDQLG